MNRRLLGAALLTALVALGMGLALRQAIAWWYPLRHREAVFRYAAENRLSPFLVAAVIRTESGWRENAVSVKGARGLMQVMPDTGRWVAGRMNLPGFDPARLFDPETNIRLGTWYLGYLMEQFHGNAAAALAAYNSGDVVVRRWLQERRWTGEAATVDQIPFPETRVYVARVLTHYRRYVRIYRPPGLAGEEVIHSAQPAEPAG